MSFLLLSFLTSIFFTFNTIDYTALAFKPTVPSESIKSSSEYVFARSWNIERLDPSLLPNLDAIAVDSSGYVYVGLGQMNPYNLIQKFDSNGKFITKWGIFWYW